MSNARQIAEFTAPEFFLDSFIEETITEATVIKDDRPGFTVVLDQATEFRVAAKIDKYGFDAFSVSFKGDTERADKITEFFDTIGSSLTREWVTV